MCGRYIAFSDASKFVLLELDYDNENEIMKKVVLPKEVKKFSSRFIYFGVKNKNVVVYLINNNGNLLVYNISKKSHTSLLLPSNNNNNKQILLDCCISPNFQNIVVSTLNREVFVYSIDALKVDNNCPKSSRYITYIKFIDENVFLILDEDNK